MTWLPTFLNWPAALIASAIAIPALLLLYFLKLRRREMKVSSTLLWRKAVQDLQVNSPFQKLRRNLLLLLQMLILLAILLALANPITFYRPGAAMNTVILIDHSASMNATDGDKSGRTRLDEAKRRAVDLIDAMPRGGRAMVISFNDSAETVQPYTTDAPALRRAIESVAPTDRPSRLRLAYQLADAQAVADAAAPSQQRVFLLSDGRIGDASEVSLRGELRYEPVGNPQSKNVAIVSLSAKRNYDNPTQVQVFARLANFGPEPVTTDVQLSVAALDEPAKTTDDFQVRQVKSDLKLPPARWTDAERAEAERQGQTTGDSVEFTLDLTSAGVIKLEQTNKDADVLSADDSACVVVPPPKPLNVALVTDGNYFLEKAVNSLGLKDPKVLSPGAWEQKPPADVDVVIFDRYVPRTLPPSGNFVWFAALPSGLPLKQAKDTAGREQFFKDQTVLDWKRDHPMLRDIPLRKIYAAETMSLVVPLADEVLIDGADGPLVVLDHAGRQTHLVIAFDALQSNWPLQIGFPMFLQRALQYLAAGSDLGVRESFTPGDSPRLPRANLDRVASGQRQITLIAPDGRRSVDVPATGDFALPALSTVGLYSTDPPVPQYERLAVNLLDEVESNTRPTDTAPGNNGPAAAADAGRTPLQWWWWLLAAVGIPLLLAEWWVYARRVHA
ncbi:MAG TPA: VWA domain-containing protein [Tepidisphaeraceae bacterium]|jgi:hypothetical protein